LYVFTDCTCVGVGVGDGPDVVVDELFRVVLWSFVVEVEVADNVFEEIEDASIQILSPHLWLGLQALHKTPIEHCILGKSQHTALGA
jgi:hypothetical protein